MNPQSRLRAFAMNSGKTVTLFPTFLPARHLEKPAACWSSAMKESLCEQRQRSSRTRTATSYRLPLTLPRVKIKQQRDDSRHEAFHEEEEARNESAVVVVSV